MPNLLRIAAVGCLALSVPAPAAKPQPERLARLDTMLARYDAMKPGAARDALAVEIDRFAGQRYATVSRLYWYQNLDDAKTAAAAQKRPILHLRMLGRLDEDLSCANSRFFRTTLYSNTDTARFLRDNFVLYWSSERPVPRVTIDFGDGRKIERTTTGNSAHYVMDERGRVLDVLPGLYAAPVFRKELAKSVDLARQVRGKPDAELLAAVLEFHRTELQATYKQFAAVAGTNFIRRRGRLIGRAELGASAIESAQRATFAKMAVEVPDLQKIGIDAGTIDPKDLAQWATIGQKVWDIGLDKPAKLVDAASTALVETLRTGNPYKSSTQHTIERLEQLVLADTALNQFQLRPAIRRQLMALRTLDWETFDRWIYASVFRTPRTDVWLGLLESTDFTGLPADGVVMP
ncbi:MAG TPA: hypothetical protein VFO79_05745 [Xanthomonadales bacterium]|nr:hypothetical protein [Xanthomonadales bacterium]